MEIFKKLLGSGEVKCPMCEGRGKLAPNEGLEVRLGEDPDKLSVPELALVLAHTSKLEELSKKLGVDPYSVKVSFDFKNSGHHMCFMVAREEK